MTEALPDPEAERIVVSVAMDDNYLARDLEKLIIGYLDRISTLEGENKTLLAELGHSPDCAADRPGTGGQG